MDIKSSGPCRGSDLITSAAAVAQGEPVSPQDEEPGRVADAPDSQPTIVSGVPSPQALELSNSRALSRFVTRFPDQQQFALQLDYHLQYRGGFDFLPTEAQGIAKAFDRPDSSAFFELGIEMTPEEWTEFQRRERVLDVRIDVIRLLTGRAFDAEEEAREIEEGRLPTGPLLAAVWQDHSAGGTLAIAVTDVNEVPLERLAALVPGGLDSVTLIEQSESADDLYELRGRLAQRLFEADQEVGIGFEYSLDAGVQVGIFPIEEKQRGQVGRIIADQFRGDPVSLGETVKLSDTHNPKLTHSQPEAGLRIGTYSSHPDAPASEICTWGHSGHTATTPYILTAGHCLRRDVSHSNSALSGSGITQVRQGPWGNFLTTSNSFTYARNDRTSVQVDAGRVSANAADTNCYHGTHSSHGPCHRTMTSRISLYGHAVGQSVCANLGQTGALRCGQVGDIDRNSNVNFAPGGSGPGGQNRIIVEMASIGGDSGSGMFAGSNIHGIITEASAPNEAVQWTAFVTAYHFKQWIGIDYNCVRSGNWWGACPIKTTRT